jgi:beta-lactamase class A
VNGLPSTAQAAPPQRRRQIQSRPHKPSPLTYAVRLLIFGVGVGAIAGTILSLFSPAIQPSNGVSQAATNTIGIHSSNAQSGSSQSGSHPHLTPFMQLGQELTDLKRSLQNLTAQYPDLTPGIFLVDLDSNAYIDLNAAASFPAASTIKVPILVALLQDVDAGKIQLDQLLTMESEDVTDGSGDMQYQAVGTQYTVLETADMMITISDNTATNMLIRRLGGAQLLNQRFQSWGLENTVIRSPLADLGGTNTTSPKDLSELLVKVSQGDLLSLRSRDRLLKIMQSTVTNTLIPEGVADNQAVVAHKTGTIDSMVGDTGIVDMPTGKRFVITVLMQRSSDDGRAQELIRQICREVYDYLKQPTASRSTLTPSSTDSFNSPVIEQPTIP